MLSKGKPYYRCHAVLLTVILAACNGMPPPKWERCASARQEPVSQPVNATDDLVVYLDTSASMAGYLSPNGKTVFALSQDGSTIFSKTLRALEGVVNTITPTHKVAVRRVDKDVSPVSYGSIDLSQNSQTRSIYSGGETNLAGAIKKFSEPLDSSADQVPPRFHILVTDGVQSSDKSNRQLSCDKGSHPQCVQNNLLELINAGWGGAIIGMRSEFGGNIYSEISEGKFPYSSGKEANKFRPFYLYIFSPDRSALEPLIESLKQKLSMIEGASYREYGVTAGLSSGVATVEIIKDRSGKLLRVQQQKVKEGEVPRIEVNPSNKTQNEGPQKFVLRVKPDWTERAKNMGAAAELAQLVKWEAESVYPEQQIPKSIYPHCKLLSTEVVDGNTELTFETGFPMESGNLDWRMFRIVGRLDKTKNAPQWISLWTTDLDTSVEMANRTLNFETSVANLWNNPVLNSHVVGEFCLRIGPN